MISNINNINIINNNNNNNKIKQSALCCIYCGKSYKTRKNLDKHIILCEICYKSKINKNKTTNNNNNNNTSEFQEEDIIIPSQKHMYQIVLELTLKCNRLEDKVNELTKFMTQKIKKIDVLQYLTSNLSIQPTIVFDNITEIIKVSELDVEYLFNNSYLETMNYILSRSIYNDDANNPLPMMAFIQKPNYIYIFDKTCENKYSWHIIPREKFVKFLNIIQFKISKAFSEWRKNNLQNLMENDNQSILYDKTFSKLMAPEFKKEATYNKYFNNIYNKIKKDINICIVDVDF
jgi:hypothetical protein